MDYNSFSKSTAKEKTSSRDTDIEETSSPHNPFQKVKYDKKSTKFKWGKYVRE